MNPVFGNVRVIGYDLAKGLVRVELVDNPQMKDNFHPGFLRPLQGAQAAVIPPQQFATLAEALAVQQNGPININAEYTDPINQEPFVNGENVYKLNDMHIFRGPQLRTVWQGNAAQGIQSRFINPLTGQAPKKNKVKRGTARIVGGRRKKHSRRSSKRTTRRR
jgi:hypothetical protein